MERGPCCLANGFIPPRPREPVLRMLTAGALILALLALAGAQTPLTPPTIVVFADRPVYRQGETVVIKVQTLDEELNPSPGISVIITVTDPVQATILDNAVRTDLNGGAEIALELPADVPEGEYLIEAVDEANVYTPAVAYFLVCNACQVSEMGETTVISTVTTTAATTSTTTRTTTQQFTVTEQILTRDTLLTSILAVIAAIFAAQIIFIRRMTRTTSSQQTRP